MHAVEVKQLNKTFGNTVILNDIDLEMEAGGFTVLLGPSGCGKSTLLRLIAGLEEVTAGQVVIGGKDVTIADPKDRDIAMVFQSYALFPHMTVRENIGFGMLINKKPKDEISMRGSGSGRSTADWSFVGPHSGAAVRWSAPASGNWPGADA